MYSSYGFHSMSKQYRQEALRDALTRHLEGWLRMDRQARFGRSRAGLASGGVLSVLHAVVTSR
jgi:hypothetical protein